ncbi:hypothetical protein D918_03061 [Trichuris suis]|nr:hypothetical protein D918_03061 [Trichuris suis]
MRILHIFIALSVALARTVHSAPIPENVNTEEKAVTSAEHAPENDEPKTPEAVNAEEKKDNEEQDQPAEDVNEGEKVEEEKEVKQTCFCVFRSEVNEYPSTQQEPLEQTVAEETIAEPKPEAPQPKEETETPNAEADEASPKEGVAATHNKQEKEEENKEKSSTRSTASNVEKVVVQKPIEAKENALKDTPNVAAKTAQSEQEAKKMQPSPAKTSPRMPCPAANIQTGNGRGQTTAKPTQRPQLQGLNCGKGKQNPKPTPTRTTTTTAAPKKQQKSFLGKLFSYIG